MLFNRQQRFVASGRSGSALRSQYAFKSQYGGDIQAVPCVHPCVHRRVQTLARLAALIAALLIGGDEAELSLVDGLSSGARGTGALVLLVSAAAAETAGASQARAQAGPPVYPGGSLTGLFQSGGWLGGFAAGFLGSGLLGVLFGRGLVGELGSIPSYFGLAFQLVLLAMLCRLIWTRWRRGGAERGGALSPRQLADPYLRSRDDLHGGRDRSSSGYDGSEPDTASPPVSSPEISDLSGKCR